MRGIIAPRRDAMTVPEFQFESNPSMLGHGQFNTDKVAHGYIPAYLEIAGKIRSARAVCEIGVQEGGSLSMWQKLFPHAKVVGVDIDNEAFWPEGTVKVIENQSNTKLPAILSRLSPQYDLIVEDASHIVELSVLTWNLLWPLVSYGGFYVIEDWQVGFAGQRWHEELGRNWLPTVKKYRHGLIIFHKVKLWHSY